MADIPIHAAKVIGPFLKEEYKKMEGVDTAFKDLETSLVNAEKLLHTIDFSQDNENLQNRVKSLQRLCYEVEDLIHEVKCEIERCDPKGQHRNQTLNAFKFMNKPIMIYNINNMLSKLKDQVKEVKSNQSETSVNGNVPPMEEVAFDFKNQLKSMDIESNIIMELTNRNSYGYGVSIVGIRGTGKRALANYICRQVNTKFNRVLKASFSGRSFDEKILKLEIFDGEKFVMKQSDNDNALELLKKTNNWLLWIDDVSDMLQWKWKNFENSYFTEAKGNRKCLFTTLNPTVATHTKTSPYYINSLSETCCQHLVDENFKTTKIDLSRIINKCFGLLLVADFLTKSLNENAGDDQEILQKELWHLRCFKESHLPYLASNFQSLNPRALQCFYHLSLFPQAHQFSKDDLILLWIGAGLVSDWNQYAKSLTTGQDCFNDLLNNSILQQLSAEEDSKYQMNRFTHSFAQFVAPKIYLRIHENTAVKDLYNSDLCHLSVTSDIQKNLWVDIKKRKCLRTFLSIYDSNSPGNLNKVPPDLFSKMTHLRVLVLKNTNIRELPNSTNELKRLRFLDISDTCIKKLSDDLCSLSALQILKFKKQQGISPVTLPKKFSCLTNLVSIDWEINDISKLPVKPGNIGKLKYLTTLPLFEVGQKDGYRILELQNLNRLRKSLRIINLNLVKDKEDAAKAQINNKTFLRRLELVWNNPQNDKSAEVLSALEPCYELKELQIENYKLDSYPTWFSKTSHKLKHIHLKNCSKCNLLSSFGQLSALEVMHLENMRNLTSIDQLFCRTSANSTSEYFKTLESLVFSDMEDLQEWREFAAIEMPKLRELKIKHCPKLKTLPSLGHHTSLVYMEIEECRDLTCLPELPPYLQSLRLKGISDSLTIRCKSNGQDWFKLDHVLTLTINDESIKTTSENSQQEPSLFFRFINNVKEAIWSRQDQES